MTPFAGRLAPSAARLATLFLLLAAPVLAQENQTKIEDSPLGQVFRWVNFALVIALILYFGRKAPSYFRAHAEEISRRIAEGTRAREAAEKRRAEAQAKLANIGADIAQLREEAKRAAALEAERIRAQARNEAEAVERAAQAEIGATEHAARLELKTRAAQMAVDRAEALLREELKPKIDAERLTYFVAWMASELAKARRTELEGSTN
jgi:F-type H+-transporting ATPase subunit b